MSEEKVNQENEQKIKEEVKEEENGIEISTDVIAVIAGVAVSEVDRKSVV